MNPEKDAAEDREEFILRLDSMFKPIKKNEVLQCLERSVMEDLTFKTTMQLKIQKYLTAKRRFLAEYDAATSVEEKRLVVGKVKPPE